MALKTSVYLANHSISAAVCDISGQRREIHKLLRMEIPWGLVHNGRITDREQLAPVLSDFFKQHGLEGKNVSLVIDGDSVSGKIIEVPKLKPALLRRMAAVEMAAEQPAGEYIYDYGELPGAYGAASGRIYAVSAERAEVDAFAGLFEEIGVKLRRIDLALMCAMRFFAGQARYAGKTFIYSLLDGADIISVLFCDGAYSFIDRSQLMEQRGTPAAAVEVSRVLSSMTQFAYGREGINPLSHAFIGGLAGEEVQFYGDIGDALGISVGAVPPPEGFAAQPGADWGRHLFCLGDLI